MPKAKPHGYFTNGKDLFRMESKLSGGRGAILENARTGVLVSMSIKKFMALKTLQKWREEQEKASS